MYTLTNEGLGKKKVAKCLDIGARSRQLATFNRGLHL